MKYRRWNARSDKLNRQTAVTRAFSTADTTTSTYRYDKVGNLLEETNGRGYKTDYQYDKLNRQIQNRDPYQIVDPSDLPTKTEYFYTPAQVATALAQFGLSYIAPATGTVGKIIKTDRKSVV